MNSQDIIECGASLTDLAVVADEIEGIRFEKEFYNDTGKITIKLGKHRNLKIVNDALINKIVLAFNQALAEAQREIRSSVATSMSFFLSVE